MTIIVRLFAPYNNPQKACTTYCDNYVKLGRNWQAHRMKSVIDTDDLFVAKITMSYEYVLRKNKHTNIDDWPMGTKPYIGNCLEPTCGN